MTGLAAVKSHSEHDIGVVGGRCDSIENPFGCVTGARTDTGEWASGSQVKRARLMGGSGSQRTRNSISCLRERRLKDGSVHPGVMAAVPGGCGGWRDAGAVLSDRGGDVGVAQIRPTVQSGVVVHTT